MSDSVRIVVKAPHAGITYNLYTNHSATVAAVLNKLATVLKLKRETFCLFSPQKKILRAWRQLSDYQVSDGSVLFALKLTPISGRQDDVVRSYYHQRALDYFSRVPNHGFKLAGSWLRSRNPQTLSAIDGLMFIFANSWHTRYARTKVPKLKFLLENPFVWNVILQSCEQFATTTERFWVVVGSQGSKLKTKIQCNHNGTKAFIFYQRIDAQLKLLGNLENLIPNLQKLQSVDDVVRQNDRYMRNVILERRELESMLAKVSLLIRKPRIVDFMVETMLRDNGLIFRGAYEAFRTDEDFSDNVEIMVRFAEEFGKMFCKRYISVAIRLAFIDFKKLILKSMELYEPSRRFEPEFSSQSPRVAELQDVCNAGGDLLRVYPCILSRPYCHSEQGFIVGGWQEPFLGGRVSNSVYVFYNQPVPLGPRRILTARSHAVSVFPCDSPLADVDVTVVPLLVLPYEQDDSDAVVDGAALLDVLVEMGFVNHVKNSWVLRNCKYVLGDAVRVLMMN